MSFVSLKPTPLLAVCFAFAASALSPAASRAEPAREFSLKGGYFGPVLSLARFKQKYQSASGATRQISGTGKLIGAIIGYELTPQKMLLAVEGDVGFADQSNRHIAYSASVKTRLGIRKSFGTPYLTAGYTLAGVRDPASIAPKRLIHGIQRVPVLNSPFRAPLAAGWTMPIRISSIPAAPASKDRTPCAPP